MSKTKIGKADKVAIMTIARSYRSLEPHLYEERLTPKGFAFIEWCNATGTRFGRDNLDEVVAEFEATLKS